MSDSNSPVNYLSLKQDSVQIKVSVPANTIGLIIGPKGTRIKEIAESTGTYIKTPNKYREPIFEIVGLPADVEKARNQILTFINNKMNDDYIKQMMSQMPVHEPGSPVKLDLPPTAVPAKPELRSFTKLRQSTLQTSTMPQHVRSPAPGIHPQQWQISLTEQIEQLSRVLNEGASTSSCQPGHIPLNSYLSMPAELFSNHPAGDMNYSQQYLN